MLEVCFCKKTFVMCNKNNIFVIYTYAGVIVIMTKIGKF